ncbi:hypothetical protein DFA_04859 [Cavenderia fasciculata]|uniref:Tetratricopeptide-like helical domain-containing protein n=1 Tax=Cavenderia fasciculata TaxID=261658 RepID=F4PM26_CACFS|nr:uncharacterized protein DFA_04859 [Cavenderia fasciculata]EGG22729.1 hypothetical protein DFA_04859 [Cavenderia fasciculata]|eukprot:XP_004360580.1 hypothetical protein DFA_04859 [Cavenderia fasciculata]
MKRLSSLYTVGKYHCQFFGLSPTGSVGFQQQNNNHERYGLTSSASLSKLGSNGGSLMSLKNGSTRHYFKNTSNLFDSISKKKVSAASSVSHSTTILSSKELDDLLHQASALVDQGSTEESISLLSEAIESCPADPRAYGLRADLYEHTRQYQQAIPDYRKVVELLPESIPALSSLADCYASLDDYATAKKLLEQAVALDKDYLPALGSLGDLHVKTGTLDRALKYYERVVELQPHNLNGLLGLGHVALKQGSTDSAVKLYQRVVRLGASQAESLNYATGVDTNLMRLKKSAEYNPIYSASICLANIHERHGRFDNALEAINTAIKIHPGSVYAHSICASIHLRNKEPLKAIDTIDSALRVDPNNEFAKTIRADALMDMNRFKESIGLYREVIANIMERDRPDEVNTRIAILHNMIAAYIAQLGALTDSPLDIESDLDLEKESLAEILGCPENLQDLSKNARRLTKILGQLSIVTGQEESDSKRYLLALIDALNHLALTANECLLIRHNTKIDIDKESLLNPMESILYDYYSMLTSAFGTTD